MKEKNQVLTRGFLVIISFFLIFSCAVIPELKVNYSLPSASDKLKNEELLLTVRDSRTKSFVLGERASAELKNCPGSLTLNVAVPGEAPVRKGIFQVPELVEEVFRTRLENEGVRLFPDLSRSEPELLIVIKDLFLDIEDRKWVARMGYEARLIKEGKVAATRSVSGKVERYSVFGLKEANMVLSEIVTDMVNELDVRRLFRDSGL
ncbi:MAG TPA: hypothetical protein ENN86_05150 [Desulfobacteraceae bacterium]|nr:hypothetical protein [Desulfobacteraceae bacterium]